MSLPYASFRMTRDGLAICAVVVSLAAGSALAQSTVEMTPEEMRDRAVSLIYGLEGDKPDEAAGLAMLESAASAGDVPAKRALGEALLWGRVTPADPVRAQTLLQEAVSAGDEQARRLLGEQLVGGWLLPRDVPAGMALLTEAIADNDPKAKAVLAEFYLYGIGVPKSRSKALELAEGAADQGEPKALRQVGEMMMWGEVSASRAEALLTRAGELGDVAAWDALAEGAMYGYLGGGSVSRAKYPAYAERARAAGSERIAVLDAVRQMWGINMRASGPGTVEQLREAAEAGNGVAATYLVALLRDGNRLNVRRDVAAAKDALQRYAAIIGADDVWRLEQTIAAVRAQTAEARTKISAALSERPELMSKSFAEDLNKANPNVVMYLLQEKLGAEGLYRGPLDGYAGRSTLRAIYRACRSLPDNPACNDSVMRPDILAAVLAAK